METPSSSYSFEVIDEKLICFLSGKVAELKYSSFQHALGEFEDKDDGIEFLTDEWILKFVEEMKGFFVINWNNQTMGFPICPVQDTPCPFFTCAGISCPNHPPIVDTCSVEIDDVSSSNGCSMDDPVSEEMMSATSMISVPPLVIQSLDDANVVIRKLLTEVKTSFGIKGHVTNPSVFRKLYAELKNSKTLTYHSTELKYSVLLYEPTSYKAARSSANRELCSFSFISNDSSLAFYVCCHPGCCRVGTEVQFSLSHFCCSEHASPIQTSSVQHTTTRARNWMVMALEMLLEELNGDGGITPFKATNQHWMRLLNQLNRLGEKGLRIPFAGTFLTLFIGRDKPTLNYKIGNNGTTNRLCIAPFCLRIPVPHSELPFCTVCVGMEQLTNYSIDVLNVKNYGAFISGLSQESIVWLSDLFE